MPTIAAFNSAEVHRMTEIAGKSSIVTGGGSGLGRAVALSLAAEGARVVVADILEKYLA